MNVVSKLLNFLIEESSIDLHGAGDFLPQFEEFLIPFLYFLVVSLVFDFQLFKVDEMKSFGEFLLGL